ncbi:MAG: cyclopropane-fatty-acyl-phospholipid synthase family protein [Vicinamibacterales bacterium]
MVLRAVCLLLLVWGGLPARVASQEPSSTTAPAPAPARPPDIYYAPTTQVVADAMLRLAGVTPDDVVYDLGSGDGRIVILAAQKYGARGVGIEIDPALVRRARATAAEGGVAARVRFEEADLFEADIAAASVVTLYLSTSINRELAPRLRAQLRPGSRIVSHKFGIEGWPPDRHLRVDGEDVYLWTVPAR